MTERKPKQGKKLSEADLKKAKGKTKTATYKEGAEVEGQYLRRVPVYCPNGDLVWLTEDTDVTRYYTCGVCGVVFTY